MTDVLTKAQRSFCMSQIKGAHTKPELLLRSLVHGMGYRFRLHRRDLPGKPDLVFPRYEKVIFVHGCFWHRHRNCRYATMPRTRRKFWETKLEGNRKRDIQNRRKLTQLGWQSLVIWECELRNPERVGEKVVRFLETA